MLDVFEKLLHSDKHKRAVIVRSAKCRLFIAKYTKQNPSKDNEEYFGKTADHEIITRYFSHCFVTI